MIEYGNNSFGDNDLEIRAGSEEEEVAFSQLTFLYEMVKEECSKLRIKNNELKDRNADLSDKVANQDKIIMLHESDLREQFARKTVQTKKELQTSAAKVEELSKELAKKNDALKLANKKISKLVNERDKLQEWKKERSGEHSKIVKEVETRYEKEIRRMKIEWARAVKTKIENMKLRHKQELYLLEKTR